MVVTRRVVVTRSSSVTRPRRPPGLVATFGARSPRRGSTRRTRATTRPRGRGEQGDDAGESSTTTTTTPTGASAGRGASSGAAAEWSVARNATRATRGYRRCRFCSHARRGGREGKPPFLAETFPRAEARAESYLFGAGESVCREKKTLARLGRAERTSDASPPRHSHARRSDASSPLDAPPRVPSRDVRPVERRTNATGMAPAAPPPHRRVITRRGSGERSSCVVVIRPYDQRRGTGSAREAPHRPVHVPRPVRHMPRRVHRLRRARVPGRIPQGDARLRQRRLEEARRRGDLRHPCNKDDMTNCTRCGCEAGKHAVDEGADARERGERRVRAGRLPQGAPRLLQVRG